MSENKWISVTDSTPELIEGKDYSEQVLTWCNDRLMVMSYCLVDAYNDKEEEVTSFVWANCYGYINGDGEWDDNYYPTHWMPLPSSPVATNNAKVIGDIVIEPKK